MIPRIAMPNRSVAAVDKEGGLTSQYYLLLSLLAGLDILSGTGSPEGVVEAKQKTLYMDETGSSGSVLYIKQSADVSGDRTQGWIAV